jgi:hypothetical protein
VDAEDEKYATARELAASRQELLDERQSAETVIQSLQACASCLAADRMSDTGAGDNRAAQARPVLGHADGPGR